MDKKVVKPMDDGIRERAVGVPATNNKRVCYAIKTLVKEVLDLFPETPVEYSNYDGRNTALDVTFDLTVLDTQARADMIELFLLYNLDADPRIEKVDGQDGLMLVSMKASPRTQDSREPFGLADAYMVLAEDSGDTGVFGSPDIHEALTGTAWPYGGSL